MAVASLSGIVAFSQCRRVYVDMCGHFARKKRNNNNGKESEFENISPESNWNLLLFINYSMQESDFENISPESNWNLLLFINYSNFLIYLLI